MDASSQPRSGSTPPTASQPTSRPRIRGIALGPFETNCYILTPGPDPTGGKDAPGDVGCWIIDPGFEPGEVVKLIRREGLKPEAIILTHAHADHIAGIAEVRRAFPGIPIIIHHAESTWLNDPVLNLSAALGFSVTAPGPDRTINDGDTLTLGPDTWHVLHTPGHSPGGITLWHEPSRQAIVGDTLFAGSIGRSDFPGSDFDTLERSICTRLYTLPNETTVFPGHGPETTVGRERLMNPFVRG